MSMHVPPLQIPTPEEALMHRRAHTTEACHHLLNTGEDSLTLFPPRLIEAFEIEAWKDHLTPNRALVRCEDFVEWIVSPFPKGLGSNLDIVKTILVNAKDKSIANRALEMFDKAQRREPGNPNRDDRTGRLTPSVDNVNSRDARPTGNSAAAGIRRLEKEASKDGADADKAQQQLDDVRAGRKTVHGALVSLGIRKGTKPADDPLSDQEAAERQVAALMSAWNRASSDARQEFLLRIGQDGFGSGHAP